MQCLRDGCTVIAADTHDRIREYTFPALRERTLFKETSAVMFFTLDHSEKFCLVTTKDHGLKLWCLETRTMVQSYSGTVHNDLVIQSSFGGRNSEFIAAGSQSKVSFACALCI